MANQPHPTPPPAKPATPQPPPAPKPAPPPPADPQAAKQPEPAKREPPPPVKTIADEQRQRSDEIAREGVEAWKAKHDERTEEEKKGRPVTGVPHRPVDPAIEASRR